MKTLTVTKVNIGSVAKVVGTFEAVLGFIVGLVFTISVSADAITSDTTFVRALGVSVFTLGMSVILFPLISFVVGWIHGLIFGVILNFVFKETKGLELETE